MGRLERSRYITRISTEREAIRAAQHLRFLAFHGGEGIDQDRFDPLCNHVLVEEPESGQVVGTLRFRIFANGSELDHSYAALWYDLKRLSEYPAPVLELGRLCVHPEFNNPDILRLALGVLGRVVTAEKVELMIGCTSFAGTDPKPYGAAFAMLHADHLAPKRWRPEAKANARVDFEDLTAPDPWGRTKARAALPSLLRTYLSLGGWVSDHAVVDNHMQTLHVFTGVEVPQIPVRRARSLQALWG